MIKSLAMLTYTFFLRDDGNDSERSTRDTRHVVTPTGGANMVYSSFAAVRLTTRFRDIAWEDSQDLRETSEI